MTMLFADGGVTSGTIVGRTDELGSNAEVSRVDVASTLNRWAGLLFSFDPCDGAADLGYHP